MVMAMSHSEAFKRAPKIVSYLLKYARPLTCKCVRERGQHNKARRTALKGHRVKLWRAEVLAPRLLPHGARERSVGASGPL